MKNENGNKYFLWVLLVLGLVWFKSSYGKVTGGEFAGGLGGTLEKFAVKNPYPWYKEFLETVAIPNSQMFGLMTMAGEVFAALSILGTAGYFLWKRKIAKPVRFLLMAGLLTGLFLNLNFYFASGWMSPSGESLNLLMAAIQAIGLVWLVREK